MNYKSTKVVLKGQVLPSCMEAVKEADNLISSIRDL